MSAIGDPDATRLPEGPSDFPDHIGPYHLLQKLGEGGMGEVWVAEQREPIRRTVALKIIKVGMDTRQVVARFEAERQALAVMDHPTIAKVLDAGATDHGRPYFVMEHVKGEPITTYCDREQLSTDDRLALFIRVCEGVQHAHQKGIIHRDLKPSNVLVTMQDGQPVPKIIDFGIAKATGRQLAEGTVFTELGVLVGTPEYMSPEQAEMSGVDIDTRTDIYSLGVLLYELLTGSLPFESKTLREKALDEIRRTIREVDPPRPSTRITQLGPASTEAARVRHTEPSRLASQLRGDLDWITMRALEKNRTRRYDAAIGLANDVRRHLAHEPVSASPPSTVYRTKKFVRRHRLGVAAASAVVLLLLAFGSSMAVQARRIARERDRANREAETSREISSFLVGLFEVSQPSEATANSVTAREILDQGADRVEQALRSQPEVRAALLSTMGRAYFSLGLYKKAEQLLEEALSLRRKGDTTGVEVGRELMAIADVRERQGRYADAESGFRDALKTLRSLRMPDDTSIAECVAKLAYTLAAEGNYAEAEPLARQSVGLSRQIPKEHERVLALTLNSLGSVLLAKGDRAEAEQTFAEELELDRRTFGAAHPRTLTAISNLAVTRTYQRKYAEAEEAYRQLLALRRDKLGSRHPDVASTLNNLGAVLFYERRYREAEAAYREARELGEASLGGSHPRVARYLKNEGQALAAQGEYRKAEDVLRRALAIERDSIGNDHPSVALTLVYLSDCLRRAGRPSEAERLAREALDIDTRRLGPDHARTREASGGLALAEARQRRWAEAEPGLLAYAAALETNATIEGDFAEVARQIVEMYASSGRPDKAAEWRKKLPQK